MSPRSLALLSLLLVSDLAAADLTLLLDLKGEKLIGTPLYWSPEKVFLLNRDGRMLEFHPREAQNPRPSNEPFRSVSASDLRGTLIREFGSRFEVTGTGHFLVVHPVGEKDWPGRFEELYRSFVHYFTARGWKPSEPRFPLVAVIQPNQAAFAKAAFAEGNPNVTGVLGYYSAQSNRIAMYDVTASHPGVDWRVNAETIIHEAAHQTAFNCGVHTRYAATPRWVTEGLGCLFEARGVHSSSQYPHQTDRLNAYRLAAFRQRLAKRQPDGLAQFISSDRLFQTNAEAAYAEAWVLTFFLSETEPRKYLAYLQKTAALKPCVDYPAPQRLKDFTDIFGQNLAMLDARMVRFAAELGR